MIGYPNFREGIRPLRKALVVAASVAAATAVVATAPSAAAAEPAARTTAQTSTAQASAGPSTYPDCQSVRMYVRHTFTVQYRC